MYMRISCLAPASQCGNSPTEAAHACALLTVRTHITRIQPGVLGNKDKTESTVVVDVPYSSPRDLLIQFWPARLCEERRKTVITTTTHVYQTTLAQRNQMLEYVAQQTNKDAKHTSIQ